MPHAHTHQHRLLGGVATLRSLTIKEKRALARALIPEEYAAGALMALSDHQPDAERVVDLDQRHVMMSCKPGA